MIMKSLKASLHTSHFLEDGRQSPEKENRTANLTPRTANQTSPQDPRGKRGSRDHGRECWNQVLSPALKRAPASACSNHPLKRAKYKTIDEEDLEETLYCTKCTIRLVSQGFRVVELREDEPGRESRDGEIRAFLAEVRELRPQLEARLASLQEVEQDYHQTYLQKVRDIDNAIDEQIALLEAERRKLRRELEAKKYEGQAQLQDCLQQLARSIQDLEVIHEDIVPNIDRIKKVIEHSQYSQAMSNYRAKLD
jgi:hypothetical protein